MSSIVSHEWELVDPCPDIHALFIEFNFRFFWGKLDGVEVKWSPRMTLCAGVCSYEGRGGLCSVRLSAPLLKLRPRKDLVETLLHEMIHAFLFVTANNRDRDGHGPEFQKHMRRINTESGCNITIYHSFHEEVRLYQQHVWRCDGPCKSRKPFFGLVRRSRNSAPSSRDLWWAEHQRTCGGNFIKIQEPEEFTKKKQLEAEKKEKRNNKANGNKLGDIRKFVSPTKGPMSGTAKAPISGPSKPPGRPNGLTNASASTSGNKQGDIRKYGSPTKASGSGTSKPPGQSNGLSGPAASTSGTNKVTRPVQGAGIGPTSNISGFSDFGSGRGGRGGSGGTATANRGGKTLVVTGNRNGQQDSAKVHEPETSFIPFRGRGQTIGSAASSTGNPIQDRQKFLDRFNRPKQTSTEHQPSKKQNTEQQPSKKQKTENIKDEIHCPVCNNPCAAADLNSHLEQCLQNLNLDGEEVEEVVPEEIIILSDDEDETDMEQCPLCSAYYPKDLLQGHIENCVQHLHDSFIEFGDEEVKIEPRERKDKDVKIEPREMKDEDHVGCPVCGAKVKQELINEHLDQCLS